MKRCNTILSFAIIGVLITGTGARAADDKNAKPVTKEELEASFVTRVYSLQELNSPNVDYPLSSSTYQKAFVAPSGQSTATAYNGAAGSSISLYGSGGSQPNEGKAPAKPSPGDDIVKMIEDFVATDSWMDNGGQIGRIRDVGGALVIRQTEANHALIAKLLNDVTNEQRGMVRVSADWLLMSPADAAKINKPKPGAEEQAITPVDPAVLNTPPAGARHFAAQTVSRSGQTVYLLSGLDRSLVTSATPVVSTGIGAYSADVSHVGSGLAMEVNSRVNWDQHTALVTVASTFSDPVDVSKENVTISAPTSQPGGGGAMVLLPSTAGFQPFSRAVQDMRTTLRLPLGVPVIAGSMTLKPDTRGDDEQVMVLVLKVTASR